MKQSNNAQAQPRISINLLFLSSIVIMLSFIIIGLRVGKKYTSSNNTWTKVSNSRFENTNKCLWIDTSKSESSQNLDEYLTGLYQTTDLSHFLSQKQYKISGYESRTISSQGIGEMFTLYLKRDNQIYSLTFNLAVAEGGTNEFLDMCENNRANYLNQDIDSAINSIDSFLL